jgi:hypothetical protein
MSVTVSGVSELLLERSVSARAIARAAVAVLESLNAESVSDRAMGKPIVSGVVLSRERAGRRRSWRSRQRCPACSTGSRR